MNAELGSVFDELAATMENRVEDWAARAIARCEEIAPEWLAVPELDRALRVSSRESIFAELTALRHGGQIPEKLPPVDVEGARLCARFTVPLHLATYLYRVGHFVQWEAWFDLVEQKDLAPEARRALLERGSRFFFAYADRMSGLVSEEYARERERMLGGRGPRMMDLVRDVLDGRIVDTAKLGYPVEAQHLAVVAWGAHVQETLRDLAESLRRRLLTVAVTHETQWAWLGGHRELSESDREALRRFKPHADTRLAIGTEGAGADGFRRSHRRALMAQRAADALDGATVHYEDVAIEALALNDEDAARDFVARELRGIDGPDTRSARLRETLEAYFASTQNAATTAAVLGVHEQTVAQRLRAVEERIGRSVLSRRAELEVALRMLRQQRHGTPGS